ncbi:hypothetical protein BDA99DRAFT_404527, partial [Phascolomyces articulosus]
TRTVWWRLLSNRIPTRSLLHQHVPSVFSSPTCQICSSVSEDLQHFFVFCPPKQRVWKIVLERCESDWAIDEISTFICHLRLPQRQLHKPVPILNICITIYTIWRQHWRFTYD